MPIFSGYDSNNPLSEIAQHLFYSLGEEPGSFTPGNLPVYDLSSGFRPANMPDMSANRLTGINTSIGPGGSYTLYQISGPEKFTGEFDPESNQPITTSENLGYVVGPPRAPERDRGFFGGLASSLGSVLKEVPILPMAVNMVAPGYGSALTVANAVANKDPLAALAGIASLAAPAMAGTDAATAASDLAKIEASMGIPSALSQTLPVIPQVVETPASSGIASALPSDLATIEASMGPPSLIAGVENALPQVPNTYVPPTIDTGIAASDLSKIESMMGPVEGIKALPTEAFSPPAPPDEYFTSVKPLVDTSTFGLPAPPDEYFTSGITSTETARPPVTEVTAPTGIAQPEPTLSQTLPVTPPVVETPAGILSPEAKAAMAVTGPAALGSAAKAALYSNEGYGPMSDLTVEQAPITTSPISSTGPAATISDIAEKGLGSLLDKVKTPEGLLTLATLFGSGALSNLFGSAGFGGATGGGSNVSIPTKTATQTLLPMPEYKPYTGEAVMGRQYFSPVTYAAEGGIMHGRYLRGESDGMADEIKTSIEDEQPARLSHGEFVIPADVVSHLGNGNSDAGAKVLYKMMDKVRVARTGSKEQGKQIKPEKFTPGGEAKFQTGGTTSTANPFTASPYGSTAQTELSGWAAPYVTGILSEARALGQRPYTPYMGPISAGYSPLQRQAFEETSRIGEPAEYNIASGITQGLAGAQQAYNPMLFMPTFQAPTEYRPTGESFIGQSEQYMNPYMSAVLAPQLQAIRRQADIQKTMLGPQMVKGGFGSRSQLAQRQTDAEAMRQQQQAIGSALGQAYQQGMGQFNVEQARRAQEAQFGAQQAMQAAQLGAQYGQSAQEATERSRQFAAQQGLSSLAQRLQAAQALGSLGTARAGVQQQNLAQRLASGAAQRAIEQEGIAAMKSQFEEERKWPYSQLQFQQGVLQGLPIQTTTYTPNLTDIQRLAQTGKDVGTLYDMFKNIFGIK